MPREILLKDGTKVVDGHFSAKASYFITPGEYAFKGSVTLRDEIMLCQTHDSLITFNNGLGSLKTKSGGAMGFQGGP